MTVEIIYDQSPRKYGTGPGSNSQPLDLQSDSHLLPDTLPTALRGVAVLSVRNSIIGLSFRPVSADSIDLFSHAFGLRGDKLNSKQTKFSGKKSPN